MIYLDSSVVLAHVLAADTQPSPEVWDQSLVSSRLLEYELGTRLSREGPNGLPAEAFAAVLRRVALVELAAPIAPRWLGLLGGGLTIPNTYLTFAAIRFQRSP